MISACQLSSSMCGTVNSGPMNSQIYKAHPTPKSKVQQIIHKRPIYTTPCPIDLPSKITAPSSRVDVDFSSKVFAPSKKHKPQEIAKEVPSKKTKLMLVEGSWRIFHDGGPIIRVMKFACSAQPLIGVSIFGYRNGGIEIVLTDEAAKQLSDKNATLKGSFIPSFRMFQAIDKCYEFPEDQRGLVRTLISYGNWNTVTPLSEEEEIFLHTQHNAYQLLNSFSAIPVPFQAYS